MPRGSCPLQWRSNAPCLSAAPALCSPLPRLAGRVPHQCCSVEAQLPSLTSPPQPPASCVPSWSSPAPGKAWLWKDVLDNMGLTCTTAFPCPRGDRDGCSRHSRFKAASSWRGRAGQAGSSAALPGRLPRPLGAQARNGAGKEAAAIPASQQVRRRWGTLGSGSSVG